jgi:hypothetical protein
LITSYFYYTQIQREAIKKLLDTLNKFIRAPTIGPLALGGTALKASALSNIHLKAPLPATDTVPWHFEAVIQPSDTCRFCFPVRPRHVNEVMTPCFIPPGIARKESHQIFITKFS